MKLRQTPQDFLVEELLDLEISQEPKEFKIYLLEKSGLENFAVVRHLSIQNNVPSNMIEIAGLKDKHAITKQHLSIPSKYELKETDEKNLKIKFLGYSSRPLKVGKLIGNRFELTIRDIKKDEIPSIKKNIEIIKSLGVPNYFDSQRFGSVIHNEFIAKYILKNDYESAVKAFLTNYTRHEKSSVKNIKRNIKENWENIKNLKIDHKQFARIIDTYKKTGDWKSAYLIIPENLREMFVLAYQSHVWNECIKYVLFKDLKHTDYHHVDYSVGKLYYFKTDPKKTFAKEFPTASKKMDATEKEADIISQVLERDGIKIEELTSAFRPYMRPVIITLKDFSYSEPETDELNSNPSNKKFKMALKFSLPKGSYATVVTKGIFLH